MDVYLSLLETEYLNQVLNLYWSGVSFNQNLYYPANLEDCQDGDHGRNLVSNPLLLFVEIRSLSFLGKNILLFSFSPAVCLISCSKRNLIIKIRSFPYGLDEGADYPFERHRTCDVKRFQQSQRLASVSNWHKDSINQWLKMKFKF